MQPNLVSDKIKDAKSSILSQSTLFPKHVVILHVKRKKKWLKGRLKYLYFLFYVTIVWSVWITEGTGFELTVQFRSKLRHLNLGTLVHRGFSSGTSA